MSTSFGTQNTVQIFTEDSSSGTTVPNKSTSGAAHVESQGGSTWAYGNFPATWYLDLLGTVGVNDNDVVYTSPDVSAYNVHIIECTAGTVDIQVSVDGTNFNTTHAAVLLHDDVTLAGGVFVVTIASGKVGILRGKYRKIKILQNGATASNARGGHGVE